MSRSFFILLAIILIAPSPLQFRGMAESAFAVAARMQSDLDKGVFPTWWNPTLPEAVQGDVKRKSQRIAEKLNLNDVGKQEQVASLLSQHYARVWAWHQLVDDSLNDAWSEWDGARDHRDGKAKDELRALTIATERIDPIQAEFEPQIQGLLKALRQEIGEEKTTEVMDLLTRSPGAHRTYNAYLEMVPEMEDEEKAILWGRMAQARVESLSAWSDKQVIKIFKKYKIRNEFSIDYFGYDYRKRYEAWAKSKR